MTECIIFQKELETKRNWLEIKYGFEIIFFKKYNYYKCKKYSKLMNEYESD